MPTIGNGGQQDKVVYHGGENQARMSVTEHQIPEDGWITLFQSQARAEAGSVGMAAVLYRNRDLVSVGPEVVVGTNDRWVQNSLQGARFGRGDYVQWGIVRVQESSTQRQTIHAQFTGRSGFRTLEYGTPGAPPSRLPTTSAFANTSYNAYYNYVANQSPNAPTISNPASGASVNTSNVTVSGSLSHPSSEGGRDHTIRVRIQVFPKGGSTPIVDKNYDATSSSSYSVAVSGVPLDGGTYTIRTLHVDSWGESSAWSSSRDFVHGVNAAPSKPSVTAPTAGSVQSATTVTVSGTLPHDEGDGAYDHSTQIQIQAFESGATSPMIDQTYNTTSTEQRDDTFSRSISGFTSGKGYYVRFRHKDTNMNWSAYSDNRSFTITLIPDPPTLLSPTVKLDAKSGYEYRFTHQHPEGRPAKAVEVQLLNASGVLVWSSGTVTLTSQVAAGSNVSYTPTYGTATGNHPVLAWGTGYRWRARVQDTLNAWSEYPVAEAFVTNSPPSVPTDLFPLNNARTGERTWTAAVSDPNGDKITEAQIEIVRVSTGAVIAGYPKQATIANGRASFIVPESDLVAGFQYRFRFRATDGLQPGYGNWSGYNLVNYAIAPVVRLLTPAQDGRTNLIHEPSAEYAPPVDENGVEVGFWEILNQNQSVGNAITREETDDAAFGVWRWVGERRDPDSPAALMQTRQTIAVDQLERYLAQLSVKSLPRNPSDEDIPVTASLMEVLCYDASGAQIGVVIPASIQPLNGNPNGFWTRYGGAIWPSDESSTPKFPTGTTQVRIRIAPVMDSYLGRVAFDAVAFEQMPDATTGTFAGQQYADSSFFGYGSPETDGYGQSAGEWNGDPGRSPSKILPVLVDPASNHVMYSYTHASGTAINATRIIVQRWSREIRAWRPHHDSGYLAPAATPTVSLPDYLFRNESRYRVRVVTRDANAIIGESAFVEFVARFTGPPELPIISYSDEPAQATITVEFESTGLSESEFEGIEIARSAEDEPMKIVAIVRNMGASSYTYHFPVSGKQYRIYVRQVKSVGPERIEGRWRYVDASVSYRGYSFLKNSHRPTEYVLFQHANNAGPNQSRDAAGEGYAPWGSVSPVHLFGEMRLRSDTTTFEMFDSQPQSITDRLRLLKAWHVQRPPVCLLVNLPEPEKTFVALTGAIKLRQQGRVSVVEIEWQETSYQEPTPKDIEGGTDVLTLSDLGVR